MTTDDKKLRTTMSDGRVADVAVLLSLVESTPGVHGIEPGVSTTLRAIDARLRARDTRLARHGLVIEPEGAVVIEVGVDPSRPVRETVEDIQNRVREALGDDDRTVTVSVQSLVP